MHGIVVKKQQFLYFDHLYYPDVSLPPVLCV